MQIFSNFNSENNIRIAYCPLSNKTCKLIKLIMPFNYAHFKSNKNKILLILQER